MCRLPIDRGTGAFLDIPSTPIGAVNINSADDPASQVKLPNGEPRVALTYDWPFQRWLPVPQQWVAPDGAHYVYTDSVGRIHLVGVSNSLDAVIATGASWGLYGFTNTGIYASKRVPTKQPSLIGLWRIAATGGTAQQLLPDGTWLVVGADAAWSVVQDAGPPPRPAVPEGSFGTVLKRFDLTSRQVTTWYTSASGRFRVATLDSSDLPLLVNVDTGQLLIVTAAGAAQTIETGGFPFELMADSHGVWLAEAMPHSVYLVEGSTAIRLGQYGYGGTMLFAGACQ